MELNETREEITRLEDEIRRDEPEVLQMSLAELRSVNDHLAEDLRILADKFPPATKARGYTVFDTLAALDFFCIL